MYPKILVPIDGSRAAAKALREALRFARQGTVRLRLIHVLDDSYYPYVAEAAILAQQFHESMRRGADRLIGEAAEQARQAGVEVETAILEPDGRPLSRIISDEAARWSASLIAMGTHGRHGIEHWVLGSVAEGVARITPVPLLLVRDPEDVDRGRTGAERG